MQRFSRRRLRRLLLLAFVVALCTSVIFASTRLLGYANKFLQSTGNIEDSGSAIEHPYFAMQKRKLGVGKEDFRRMYEGAECASQCDDVLRLYILVCSAANNNQKRAAIRETWASAYRPTKANTNDNEVHVRFVVGNVDDELIMSALRQEASRFGDLIIVLDVGDVYMELIKKVLRGFQFLVHCLTSSDDDDTVSGSATGELKRVNATLNSDASCNSASLFERLLVIKTDDDNYVNIPKLLDFAKQYSSATPTMTIYGCLQERVAVRRRPTDKWYVPIETYPHEYYPDYVTGPLYVAPFGVIRTLVDLATHFDQSTPILSWEDIFFTGVLAQKVVPPIGRQSLPGVHWQRVEPLDACNYRTNVINSHYIAPNELRHLWTATATCK